MTECARLMSRLPSSRFAAILHLVTILCSLAAAAAASAFGTPDIFFTENFNSGQPSPNLEGYGNFKLENGKIRRNGTFSDGNDRQYMRTAATNYNELNFRYELTFTTSFLSDTSINYMGIGSGARRPGPSQFGHNEAWESVYLRVHTPNVAGGYVGITNHPATDLAIVGAIPGAGTHRGRIEKFANELTFSIDANYNGNFVADLSYTFPDLTAVAPFLNNTNSRLFFGTVFPDDTFDDLRVVPEPASFSLAVISATAFARRRRRGN